MNQKSPMEKAWSADEDWLDLQVVSLRIWSHRWWVLSAGVLLALLAGVFVRMSTPIYRSTSVLIPANADRNSLSGALGSALGQLGGLASIAGVSVGGADSNTNEALAVLQSQQFLNDFIQEHQLVRQMGAGGISLKLGQWEIIPERLPSVARAFRFFNTRVLTVTQDRKTGLVKLQIDWKDRNQAAEWANELVRKVNTEMQRRSIEKTTASMGFLEQELKTTQTLETREAINRLIEAQVKQRMLAAVTPQYAFRVIDPALPADVDSPERPRKIVWVLMGLILGLVLGSILAIVVRRGNK